MKPKNQEAKMPKGTDADGAWLGRLGAAAAVCALLLGAVIALCHLGFETNDDVGMLKLAAGLYDGRPGPHLVLINVVLGSLLAFLYERFAHISWYEILFLTVHWLALSLLLFVLFLRRFSWRTLLPWVAFFLTFELVILCRMSFTTTAFMGAMSGVLLVVAAFSTEKPFPRTAFAVVGGCLLVASGMVRLYSLWLALVLSVPFLLAVERSLRLRVWLTIALATVASLGFSYTSLQLHKQAGWSDYLVQNRYRWALQDSPRLTITDETRPFFDQVGWGEHEVALFRYFLYDNRVYSPETMKYLSERLAARRPIREVIGQVPYELSVHKITLALAAALAGLVLLLGNRKNRRIMMLTAVWSVVVFLGLIYAGKPAFRLVHSVIVFDAAVALFLLCDAGGLRSADGLRRWTVWALIALLTVGTLVQSYRMRRESARNQARGRQFDECTEMLSRLEPDAIIVPYGGTYPLPLFLNLDKLRSPRTLPSGWMINSPVYDTMKRRLGVAEVHRALLEREHCYLQVEEQFDYHLREHLPPFFKRHYGVDVSLETVARGGGCMVYRLIPTGAPNIP
jgi:hypothetical protein